MDVINRSHITRILFIKLFFIGLFMPASAFAMTCDSVKITYKLHGQTRRFNTSFCRQADGAVVMKWDIVRNLKTWHGSYTMLPEAVKSGTSLSYLMPEDGNNVVLSSNETFAILSRQALHCLIHDGKLILNNIDWTLTSAPDARTITAVSHPSGATMEVVNDPSFPLIVSMQGNPLEINWTARIIDDTPKTTRQLIAEDPGRSGGIYYAYPFTTDEMPPLPPGYEVTFLSHYGRHGSRWLIKAWEYDEAMAAMDSAARVDGLTPLGMDVRERLRVITRQAQGNDGALSPLGERQHRHIAERMFHRFPHLFTDTARHIESYSSTTPRCIISMASFNERLKELNPSLKIQRHASPGDMRFISYSSPEMKAVNDPSAPWWNDLEAWRDSVLRPERLMAALFTDPSGIQQPVRMMWLLHDIAIDTQDVEPGVELLDIFTTDELYHLWSCLNYKMYYLHGNNPATGAPGPRSAAALLRHFTADIDSAATGLRTRRSATLRFGHDTALMRLMALMNMEGADASVSSPRDIDGRWTDFLLTPMGANLQVVLLTSTRGDEPLILLRHNERTATLP
ncbi:MAG: hypothetical protein K2L41_00825, partial [Muribaculaceae bacterium]|nr:hypothetical protein [Muribaculaceae bacterium]